MRAYVLRLLGGLSLSGLICLVALPSAAFAQSSTETEAGDVSEVDKDSTGPLRDRVRPVSGHVFLMKHRFELSPGVGISFKDAFFTKYSPGLMMSFHVAETVGIVLRGSYAFNKVSGAAQICETLGVNAGCREPTSDQLDLGGAYGRMGLIADLDLEWAPIYGKLAALSEAFLYFNMYLSLGPTAVMYGPSNNFTVGGNVGIGFRFFVTRWFCVRTELRDVIYNETRQGTGVAMAGESSIRNQLFLELGLSFFLPTDFEEK